MSAFVVSYDHINAIIDYAKIHCIHLPVSAASDAPLGMIVTVEHGQAVGECLISENLASVSYRYRMDARADNAWHDYRYVPHNRIISHRQAMQAVSCLDYQSCEHPEWETSHACKILRAIAVHAAKAKGSPMTPDDREATSWGIHFAGDERTEYAA